MTPDCRPCRDTLHRRRTWLDRQRRHRVWPAQWELALPRRLLLWLWAVRLAQADRPPGPNLRRRMPPKRSHAKNPYTSLRTPAHKKPARPNGANRAHYTTNTITPIRLRTDTSAELSQSSAGRSNGK